jgi:hypothetical protein
MKENEEELARLLQKMSLGSERIGHELYLYHKNEVKN